MAPRTRRVRARTQLRQPRALRVSVGCVTFPPCRVSSRAQSSCFSVAAVAALAVNQIYPNTWQMRAQLAAGKPAAAVTSLDTAFGHHLPVLFGQPTITQVRSSAGVSARTQGSVTHRQAHTARMNASHSCQLPNPAPGSPGPWTAWTALIHPADRCQIAMSGLSRSHSDATCVSIQEGPQFMRTNILQTARDS